MNSAIKTTSKECVTIQHSKNKSMVVYYITHAII
jgi:hypothetical protein